MQFTAEGRGRWKKTPNSIVIKWPDSTQALQAKTSDPDLVDIHIDELIDRFDHHTKRARFDPRNGSGDRIGATNSGGLIRYHRQAASRWAKESMGDAGRRLMSMGIGGE